MIGDKEGEGGIILYESNDGKMRINVRLEDGTTWLSQQQLAELFQTSRTNIIEHIQNIYNEEELDVSATCRKFRQVQIEGVRKVSRELPFYNLDMIISLGYRINSKIATAFRQWATTRLKEYIIKRFKKLTKSMTSTAKKSWKVTKVILTVQLKI